jgi:hypothetical protein
VILYKPVFLYGIDRRTINSLLWWRWWSRKSIIPVQNTNSIRQREKKLNASYDVCFQRVVLYLIESFIVVAGLWRVMSKYVRERCSVFSIAAAIFTSWWGSLG